jgi:hypothetical protein
MSNINVVVSPRAGIDVRTKKPTTVLINQSGSVPRSLGDLIDVDTSAKTDGSLLIYDEEQEKFTASTLLEKQTVNGGHF